MAGDPRTEVTQLLGSIQEGDSSAADQLLPLVYEEMRKLAKQRMSGLAPGQTLQATALVHEAYMRLVSDQNARWDSRGHFFAAAAQAMRNILVEQARRRSRLKRGGDRRRLELDEALLATSEPDVDLLALDEALRRLESIDKTKADVVMLRFFAGLTVEKTAKMLGISTATVDRRWTYARAWLHRELAADG